MEFSDDVFSAMGFQERVSKGAITASFMSVTVYEARGIKLDPGFAEARQDKVAGAPYRVALSAEVNAGCQKLIGDDFVEVEADWIKEVKTTGPFVLVAVGPTEFIACEAGRLMRGADGGITTYDSFPQVREVLKSFEERVLPPVIASITLALNEPGRFVHLRKLTRASSGRLPDGTVVHDMRMELRAELTVSRGIPSAQASEKLDVATSLAPRLRQRAARFFALGAAEDDQMKKFLYFFLSLEVETHAVFGHVKHDEYIQSLVAKSDAANSHPISLSLLSIEVARWENLFDRFAWCAATTWHQLNNDDVLSFKRLKSTRDAIAHGRISEPPIGQAREIELLTHKVLSAKTAGAPKFTGA